MSCTKSNPQVVLKPKTEFSKSVGHVLKRAANRARAVARQHGTPVHVQVNGKVIALRP